MGRSIVAWIVAAVLMMVSTAVAVPIFQERPGDTALSRLWISADDLNSIGIVQIQGTLAPNGVVVVIAETQSRAFRVSGKLSGEAYWYNSKVWFRLRDLISLGIKIEIVGKEIKISGQSLEIEYFSDDPQPTAQASQSQIQSATAAKDCGPLRLYEVTVTEYYTEYVAKIPVAILVNDLKIAASCIGINFSWDSGNLTLSLGGQIFPKSRNPLTPNAAIPFRGSYLIAFKFPDFSITSANTAVYLGTNRKANFQLRLEKISHPGLTELAFEAVDIIDKKADRAWRGYSASIVCALFELSCSVQGSSLIVNGQSISPGQSGYDKGTFYVAAAALAPFVPLFEVFEEAESERAVTSIADIRATRNTRQNDLNKLVQISVGNQTFVSLSSILGSNVDGGVKITNTSVSFPKSAFGGGLSNIPLWAPKSDGDIYAVLLDPQFMTKSAIPAAIPENRVRFQVFVPIRLVSKVYSRIVFDSSSLELKVVLDDLSDGIKSIPLSQISKRGNYTVAGLRDLITYINTSIVKQRAIDAANQKAAEAEARRQAAELDRIYQKSKPILQALIASLGGATSDIDRSLHLGDDTYAYHNKRGAVIWQVGLGGVEMCSITWLLNVVIIDAQPFNYLGQPAIALYTNIGTAIAWVEGNTRICPYIY